MIAALHAARQRVLDQTVQRRNVDLRAQRGLAIGDGHLADQMLVLALEDAVLAHVYFDIKIAARTARSAGFALAPYRQARAAEYASRNAHFQCALHTDA